MNVYKHLIRPLLFRLDAEAAHNMAKTVLRVPHIARLFARETLFVRDERLETDLAGLKLSNPVGLGAGFDKDCEMIDALQRLGFGYIVVGSVMCGVRPGNPRPRMIRDPEREALFSCMGLPSKGLGYARMRLERRSAGPVPLVINFNGMDLGEYLKCFEALQPLGDATEISLFCPNRADDAGDFLDPRFAERLFEQIARRKRKPVFIKIPGYVVESERERRLALVDRAMQYPVDGLAIAPESRVEEKRLFIGRGTITGRPLFDQILRVVDDVFALTHGRCPIKASGGIFSAQDAFEAIAAGASTVEVVTGFGYEGWRIARNINRGLIPLMNRSGIAHVGALRGTKTKMRDQMTLQEGGA